MLTGCSDLVVAHRGGCGLVPHVGAGHLAHLAADPARRRQSRSPRARRRWPPWTAAAHPWSSATGPATSGPSISPTVRACAGLAGPHRWCPDRLDSVGDPQRERHRQRLRGRAATPPTPASAATTPSAIPEVSSGARTPPDPNGLARRAGLDGGGQPQRGERGGGPVARPGRVRLQRRQRIASCRDGRSSPPTAASPRRRWPTSTATGRPKWSRAATPRPAWPTARPTPPAAISGCSAPGATSICDYDTNQTVDSSTGGRQLPRRRRRPASPSAPARSTPGASDSNTVFAVQHLTATSCGGPTSAASTDGQPGHRGHRG